MLRVGGLLAGCCFWAARLAPVHFYHSTPHTHYGSPTLHTRLFPSRSPTPAAASSSIDSTLTVAVTSRCPSLVIAVGSPSLCLPASPAMSLLLSKGAFRRAYGTPAAEYTDSDTSGQPVVQVLELKSIKNQNERFRLVLNDGEFYQQAMLGSQMNELVKREEVRPGTICKLNSFICQAMGAKRVLILLSLTPIGQGTVEPIGAPHNIEEHMDKLRAAGAQGAANTASITPLPPSAIKAPVAGYLQKQQAGSTAFGPSSSITPASSASHPLQFHPISSLNPYQNRWTIKARVTAKSDVRTWHNTRGEGKLFSVDLLDAQGGQIRATMFNDAVDKFYPLLSIDGVYTISKGLLKPANKKFSLLPNDYELTLNSDADIQFVEDDASIEQQRFNFQSIEQIGHKQENEFADVIGIVQSVSPISHITSKTTQKELTKRTVMLCDDTQLSIELTLWGEQAERYNEGVLDSHPVMAVKNVKISNFGGKTLSTTFNSQIFLSPTDRAEAVRLQQWWAAQGGHTQFTALSQRMGGTGGGSINASEARRPLSDIKDEHLGNAVDEKGDTKADYLLVKATVTKIGHDFPKPPWYNACVKCNRKVNGSPGEWNCENCSQVYERCEQRYILSLLVADPSSGVWLHAFNDQAALIVGVQASDVNTLHAAGDEVSFNKLFDERLFGQYLMKLKVKVEMQMEQKKQRITVIAVQPIDYRSESKFMLAEIEKM